MLEDVVEQGAEKEAEVVAFINWAVDSAAVKYAVPSWLGSCLADANIIELI